MIADLRARVDRLEKELAEAKEALRQALIRSSGFEEGETVEARKNLGSEWKPAIIRRVFVNWAGKYVYTVSFPKKNGAWSKVLVSYAEVRKPS